MQKRKYDNSSMEKYSWLFKIRKPQQKCSSTFNRVERLITKTAQINLSQISGHKRLNFKMKFSLLFRINLF